MKTRKKGKTSTSRESSYTLNTLRSHVWTTSHFCSWKLQRGWPTMSGQLVSQVSHKKSSETWRSLASEELTLILVSFSTRFDLQIFKSFPSPESQSDWLLKGFVDEVPLAQCQKDYNAIPNSNPVKKTQICANNQVTSTDTCLGKSKSHQTSFLSDFLLFASQAILADH